MLIRARLTDESPTTFIVGVEGHFIPLYSSFGFNCNLMERDVLKPYNRVINESQGVLPQLAVSVCVSVFLCFCVSVCLCICVSVREPLWRRGNTAA